MSEARAPAGPPDRDPDRAGEPTALPPGIRDGAWLDRQDFPPLGYAVPELLPEGFTLFVGPPKIGKSWLVVNLLLGVAAGGRVLGRLAVGEPREVLYLALEDSDRRMQARCRHLLGPGEPIPPRFHYLTRTEPGQVLATVGGFLDQQPAAALVVVDTLGKVMPPSLPGESAYQRDYRVGSALQQVALTRPGVAVVVCHHDRKAGSDDFVDAVSGTHGLAGAADSVFALVRHRNDTDALLKVTGRDIPEAEYALVLRDGRHWQLDGATLADAAKRARQFHAEARATAGTGDRMAEVVGHVLKHPQGTTTDVATALGMDTTTAAVYLGRAVKAGRLARPGRGRYAPAGNGNGATANGDRPALPPLEPAPADLAEREHASRTVAQQRAELVDRLTVQAGGSKADRRLAARLATDAPDLAAQVDAGRLPLAAAAVELERRDGTA